MLTRGRRADVAGAVDAPEPGRLATGHGAGHGADDAGGASVAHLGSLESVSALVLVLVAGLIGAGQLHDNSFLTHLATGRWLHEGNWSKIWMGNADPYLWTSSGRTWVVQSWLASFAYDGAERIAGAAGIRLLVAGTCMTMTWCLWRLTAPARTLVPRVIAVGGALAIGGTVWSERPMTFGLLFLSLSLLAADGQVRTGWLVLVGWMWVNTHGSFPLGLVALGAVAIGTHLDGRDTTRERRALRDLAIGCAAGGVLSPVGPALLWFPVTMLRRQDVLAHVQEWKSTDFTEPWARLFLLLVAVAVLTLLRRPSYRRAIPLVVFAAAGIMAGRNVVVASVVLVPVLAGGLEGIGSIRHVRTPVTRLATIALAVLTPMLVVSTATAADFDLVAYPVTSVDWLEQRGLLDGSVRVAEEDFSGNYLGFRYGGNVKAFIDDRYDMHERALVDDYVKLVRGQRGWDEVLERRGIDVVLWRRDSRLVELLERQPGWDLVFDSAAAEAGGIERPDESGYVVYCRTGVTRCTTAPVSAAAPAGR